MCRSPWTSRLAQSTTTSTLWCCSRVTLTSCRRWSGPLRPTLSARRPHGQPEGVDCRRSPTSPGNTAFAVTTTTKPTIPSTTGRGCAPPLGLLRLSSILPAVHHRPPVVDWRGFSCSRPTSSAAEPAMPSDIDLVAGYEGLNGRRCREGAPGRLAAWVPIRGGHFRAAGMRAGGGRSAGGPEGEPAVASAAGEGCGPPLGLLGLSSVLAAVCCRLSVVCWRGFSPRRVARSGRAGLGAGGWGRSTRRRCVWVSARTGGGGIGGRPGPGPSRAERRQLRRSRAARPSWAVGGLAAAAAVSAEAAVRAGSVPSGAEAGRAAAASRRVAGPGRPRRSGTGESALSAVRRTTHPVEEDTPTAPPGSARCSVGRLVADPLRTATPASSPSMRTSTGGNAERAREEPTTQTPIPKPGRLPSGAGPE